jgi:hypothetical protein
MAVVCPVDLDTARLRAEIQAIYSRVAEDPAGDFPLPSRSCVRRRATQIRRLRAISPSGRVHGVVRGCRQSASNCAADAGRLRR